MWDSNPRALADNRISSAARYDHFANSPYENEIQLNTAYNLEGHHITTHITEDFSAFLKIASETRINVAFAVTVLYYIRIHEKGQFLFHECCVYGFLLYFYFLFFIGVIWATGD